MADSAGVNTSPLDPHLKQRGRATFDFMTALGAGMSVVGPVVARDMAHAGISNETLPDDLDARVAFVEERMAASKAFRLQQTMGEFHARNSGPLSAEAYLEIAAEMAPAISKLDKDGPATLEADPAFAPPNYWRGVDFHRTTGGWDAYEMAGYVHGELIHKRLVEKLYPGGIFKQRRAVAALAPRRDYNRILDMGASTGHYTLALAETFPAAEIHGVDVSLSTLRHARRVANAHGWAWRLRQRAAEDTGYPDDHFDLVTSYILLHELPADAVRAVFEEAFRVAKPGADLVMSDVTRYAALDKLAAFKADYGATHGGEPYWRESASLDLKEVAEEVGFVDVRSEGMNGGVYPWVVVGRKPGK
jgi:SAM-dependent methyltransferase